MENSWGKKTLLGLLVGILIWSSAGMAVDDTFNVSISTAGQVQGGGSGYSSGRWHYYPTSAWYVQWFYNGPYNPDGYKTIEWSLRLSRIDIYASARATIAINWTTDQWKSGQAPPLPNDFANNPSLEEQVIKRSVIYDNTVSQSTALGGNLEITDFCPTWVSIEIKGTNIRLEDGKISHVCVAQQQYNYDYGDAPDPPYPTLNANNGASHFIDNRVYLGARVDGEADGQPNATATGDDNNGDDEDGVAFTSPLVPGGNATADVQASFFGILNAWIDFNGDGDWADPGEQISVNEPLAAGVNSLIFPVPAGAKPGGTFARFRFSSAAGLSFRGQALNGEVEDYTVRIEPGQYEDAGNLKWEQPPIDYDPRAQTPVYCGWDEPAYVVIPGVYTGSYVSNADWKIVADDFRCIGSLPVSSIHWWGSYAGWTQSEAPSVRPTAWVFGFWSNVPSNGVGYSYPGELLHVVRVPADQVRATWVGSDRFPGQPADACFKHSVSLSENQYFWQDRYLSSTRDRVFWLSVTALYDRGQAPSYPWGWKTRPAHWQDDAVIFSVQAPNLSTGYKPGAGGVRPLESSAACPQSESYDLSFALDTPPAYVKWDQPFTGLRDWEHYEDQVSMASVTAASGIALKWEQPPDLQSTGVDVDVTQDSPETWPPQILADDFECTVPGPLTGIEIWSSWFYDILPDGDAGNVRFTLNIHKDIPATGAAGYSRPGEILWTQTFGAGEFTVSRQDSGLESFYSPCTGWYIPNNHRYVYRYDFSIPGDKAFRQTGTANQPVVYWLSVQAYLVHKPGASPTRWGWKTSTEEWNDVAVYAEGTDAATAEWKTLGYPLRHPWYGRKTGLSFRLTTQEQSDGLTVQYQAADDWLCNSRTPITAAVWWGSYLGYYYQPCQCQDQPAPRKPYYFWLSLWTDVPDDYPNDPSTFSKPGQLVWEYKAFDYDEVLVGFDKHPEGVAPQQGYEPVYRYSVRIPESDWFYQPGHEQIYWFSVVAVFQDGASVPYKWGWTNHRHVYNDNAVTTLFPYGHPFGNTLLWTPLYDQTGDNEDLSFTLFTDPEAQPGN